MTASIYLNPLVNVKPYTALHDVYRRANSRARYEGWGRKVIESATDRPAGTKIEIDEGGTWVKAYEHTPEFEAFGQALAARLGRRCVPHTATVHCYRIEE